ncbi:MAG: GNAT family N-acetyltransferase [Devosia sp.]|jgi:RimJ/RimL family protein N-acetyltransferase|nr:GNAT family N-acetyltransferase [Devosiaceae bacterium]
MKKVDKKVAPVAAAVRAPRPLMTGTRASMERLEHATARLSFRRIRDALPGKIETARLVLRAPMRGDVPALVALADNKNIAEKLARLPNPYTRADAIAFIEIFAQRPDERPYAITGPGGEFMGVVGFSYAMGEHPELGYWLGEPHWGKGFMTEAVKGLLEAAFATGFYPAVRARALQSNAGSINVLTKAGFANLGAAVDESGLHKGQPIFRFRMERPR